MTQQQHLFAYILLLTVLALSLFGNFFLYKKAITFYAREAEVRITPISTEYRELNEIIRSAPRTKPRIVMFGESRCSMWRDHTPSTWGDVEIVNRGIGAETTPQIIRRLEEDVISLNPHLVILQMGDNDLKTMAVLPGTRDRTIEQTLGNITTIAKRLSDRGIQVIVTTIFPPAPIEFLRTPLWSDEVNESIDLVNQKILALDYPRVTPVDCDAILRQGKYIKPEYARDTLHLKPAGYAALNDQLGPIVEEVLAKAIQ